VTGETVKWSGRKWLLSPYMTESEFFLTCQKAVLTALEHEARENMTVDGVNVFNPHISVNEMIDFIKSRGDNAFDCRPDALEG